jgi:hypothetical protein
MPGVPNPLGAGPLASAGALAPRMGQGFEWAAAHDSTTDQATHRDGPIATQRDLSG